MGNKPLPPPPPRRPASEITWICPKCEVAVKVETQVGSFCPGCGLPRWKWCPQCGEWRSSTFRATNTDEGTDERGVRWPIAIEGDDTWRESTHCPGCGAQLETKRAPHE